jgi:hypothetical protein
LGSQCIDYSRRGQLQLIKGSSTRPLLIAIGAICIKKPNTASHEITDQGTAGLITDNNDLKMAGYSGIEVVLCPSMNGVARKRPRRYSFIWLTTCTQFHGSIDELLQLYRRSIHHSGDTFFFMEDERAAENFQRCRLESNYYQDPSDCVNAPLHEMYKARTCANAQMHEAMRATHCGLDGTLIYDIGQSPHFSSPGFAVRWRCSIFILNTPHPRFRMFWRKYVHYKLHHLSISGPRFQPS